MRRDKNATIIRSVDIKKKEVPLDKLSRGIYEEYVAPKVNEILRMDETKFKELTAEKVTYESYEVNLLENGEVVRRTFGIRRQDRQILDDLFELTAQSFDERVRKAVRDETDKIYAATMKQWSAEKSLLVLKVLEEVRLLPWWKRLFNQIGHLSRLF